ncbi:hypothetical protein NKG05_18070 [Oerskovia sp. M15]
MTPDSTGSPLPVASPERTPLPDGAAPPERRLAARATHDRGRALRDGTSGKSRLASVLDPASRSRLIAALARHVVATLLASSDVDRVLVVTSDPRFTWRALGSLLPPAPPPMQDDAPSTVTGSPAEGDGDGPGGSRSSCSPRAAPDSTLRSTSGELAAAGGSDEPLPGSWSRTPTSRPSRPRTSTHCSQRTRRSSSRPTGAFGHEPPGARRRRPVHVPVRRREPRSAPGRGRPAGPSRRRRAASGTAVDLDTLDDWAELPADVRARDELSELHRATVRARSAT